MSTKTGKLALVWAKDDQSLSAEQQMRKLKKMRRQAEAQLAEMASSKESREDWYNSLMEKSKTEDVEFKELLNASNGMKAGEIMYKEALSLYEELFGETPALV
jgi:hypothetical protein